MSFSKLVSGSGIAEDGSSCIFISNVVSESPADRKLFVGDRLLEVAGKSITSTELNVVAEAMRNSTSPIQFVVQSLQKAKVCFC